MPGMMNTISEPGAKRRRLTEGLAKATKNERFAYDAYRRLINMFGDVVMGMDHHHCSRTPSTRSRRNTRSKDDTDVPAEGLKELCDAYKDVYKKHTGDEFPQDPFAQLELGDSSGLSDLGIPNVRSNIARSKESNPRTAWYCRQCPVDGVREHGRRQRHGRRIHEKPQHRRKQVLR